MRIEAQARLTIEELHFESDLLISMQYQGWFFEGKHQDTETKTTVFTFSKII